MRRLTILRIAGCRDNIRLSTENQCHFGFSTHLARCSLGRFRARFAIAAGTDAAGPSRSVVNRWMMRLCLAERSGAGDMSSSPRRRRSGAGISFMLSSLRTSRAF